MNNVWSVTQYHNQERQQRPGRQYSASNKTRTLMPPLLTLSGRRISWTFTIKPRRDHPFVLCIHIHVKDSASVVTLWQLNWLYYLESIIGPAPKLHDTGLLIKREILDIHLNRKHVLPEYHHSVMFSPHRRNGKLREVSTPQAPRYKVSPWWPVSPQNFHRRWKMENGVCNEISN